MQLNYENDDDGQGQNTMGQPAPQTNVIQNVEDLYEQDVDDDQRLSATSQNPDHSMSQADGGKSAGTNGSQPMINGSSMGKDGSKPRTAGYDESKKLSQIIVNRNKGFGTGQGKSNL